MTYPISTIDSWLGPPAEFKRDKMLTRELPSSLLSNLSSIFARTVAYCNLTKQEALDTIGYFLYEYQDIIHSQLLDSLIDHGFLTLVNASHLQINYGINVSSIFTPLTRCYSPSCQPNDASCYSALCPNKRMSSLLHICNAQQQQQVSQTDWISTIPNHVRDSISRKELKRQAGIAELLSTEQNHGHDLDILHRIYAIPLLESNEIIENPSRRQRFYNNVFGNYLDITHLHHSFYQRLASHNRHSGFFIGRVGTIILQHITNLIEPYIQYASNHVKAIYCMTIEHKNNPHFALFLESQNAKKCTRRLGLRHYLTSPTLWMGKLKLLIEAILKNTVDDADQLSLKATLAILHDTLCRMNSSATANSSPEDFRFEELSTSIYCGQQAELHLLPLPDNCTLIKEAAVWLARSTHPLQPSLCHLILFSHALILTHPKVTDGRTEYIVIQSIPIQMLFIDSNVSSMIRRISFASTSMVSTPFHLINNLRRQKSINSEASSSSDSANSTDLSNTTSTLLDKSNATGAAAACPKHVRTVAISKPKSSGLMPFQIKTKLSKLKSNFRWSTSFSVPASPTASGDSTEVSVARRDSAPALLFSKRKDEQFDTGFPLDRQRKQKEQQQSRQQQQQQRRTLKISHMAYPENSSKLEFLSRSDRLVWENLIRNTCLVMEKENEVFKKKIMFKSLSTMRAGAQQRNANSSSAQSANVADMARIRCSFAFVYSNKSADMHKHLVGFGTPCGLWVGFRDGLTAPHLVLPHANIQKIAVLSDKLIMQVHDNKQHMLIAYDIKPLIEDQHMDWCMIKRSSVICFTVGRIRSQPVIVYLTKRLQTTWLVIIVRNEKPYAKNHWYKKYRTEYSVSVKEPSEIQIIQDAVFVRSERYGVERMDIFREPSAILNPMPYWVFLGANIGLISYKDKGIVCDSQHAYSISLFESNSALVKIKFECQAQQVAVVYPFLIAFSSNVIEVRNIETTELIQAIRGQRIKFISTTSDCSQPLYYTMANPANPRITSVYQLQLAL